MSEAYDPKPPDKWSVRGLQEHTKRLEREIARPLINVEVEINGVIVPPDELERIINRAGDL